MPKLNITCPWVTLYDQINAMFASDPSVRVVLLDSEKTIYVYAESAAKSSAINKLLKHDYNFGGVEVKVIVLPPNPKKTPNAEPFLLKDAKQVVETAFKDNSALSRAVWSALPITQDALYVAFANRVVQFFNDDLSDINGNCSTLYHCIAHDIFNTEVCGSPMFFCTDKPKQ